MVSCFALQLEHGFDLTECENEAAIFNNCNERNQRKKVKKPVTALRKLNYRPTEFNAPVYCIYRVQLPYSNLMA